MNINLIITVWKAFLELWSEEILAGSLHCISLFLFLFVFSCFSQVDSHPDCSAQGAVDVGEGSRADVIGLAWFQHVPTIRGKEIVVSTCQKIKDKRRGGKWSQHESTRVVAKVTTKKARQVLMWHMRRDTTCSCLVSSIDDLMLGLGHLLFPA